MTKMQQQHNNRLSLDSDTRGNIRLDYSDTYQENDILDLELEDELHSLHRQRYRAGIDRDESLKKARKAADDIKSLSKAIQKKEGNTSADIVVKENKLSDSTQSVDKKQIVKEHVRTEGHEENSSLDIIPRTNSRTNHIPEDESDAKSFIKPVNIAMFKLSLRTFQKTVTEKKTSEFLTTPNRSLHRKRTTSALPSYYRPRGVENLLSRRSRPNTSGNTLANERRVLEAMDIHPVALININILKRKKSRSRRELEEISKIQQEEKFGKLERINEERNKKIEWAKGGVELERKIRTFIQDIDHFNKKARPSNFSLIQYRSGSVVI